MKTNFKIFFFLTVILKIYSVLSIKSFLSIDENSLIINSPHYLNLNSIDNDEVLIITKQKLNNSNLINASLKNETNTNYSKFFILEGIANEVNISKNQENLNLKYYNFDLKNKNESILSENNINKLNITNENLTQKNENFPKINISNKIEKIDHLLNFSKKNIEQNNNYKDLLFMTSNKTEELIDGMILKNNLSKENNIVLNLTYIIVNNTNFDVLQSYLNNNSLFVNKKNDNSLNSKIYSELNIFYLNKDNQFKQSNKIPIFKTFQIPTSIFTNFNNSNSKIDKLNIIENSKSEKNLFKIDNLTNELKQNNNSKNDMEIKHDNFTFKLTNLINNNITVGPKKNNNFSQLFKNENIYENKDPWKNILDNDSNLSDDFDLLFEQNNLKKIKNETKSTELTIKNETNITIQKKINESELIYSEIPIYSNKINIKLNSTNDLNSKNNSNKNLHFEDLNKMEQPIIVKRVEKNIENNINQIINDKQNSPKNERMKQINDKDIDSNKNENFNKIEYKKKNNLLYTETNNVLNNNIFNYKNQNNPLYNDISLGNNIYNDISSGNNIIQKKTPNLSNPLTLNQPNIFVNNPNFDSSSIINTNEDNFTVNNQISPGNNKNNFINYDYLKPNVDFMNPFYENIKEKNK